MIAPQKHACKPHPYQDEKYKGQRVFTTLKDNKGYRCTVCGKIETR